MVGRRLLLVTRSIFIIKSLHVCVSIMSFRITKNNIFVIIWGQVGVYGTVSSYCVMGCLEVQGFLPLVDFANTYLDVLVKSKMDFNQKSLVSSQKWSVQQISSLCVSPSVYRIPALPCPDPRETYNQHLKCK